MPAKSFLNVEFSRQNYCPLPKSGNFCHQVPTIITFINKTNMLSLDETLRLNNEGVALFHANEIARAAEKLHSSFLGARSLINRGTAAQGISSIPNWPYNLKCCEESRNHTFCSNDRNEFFLCFRAFSFRGELGREQEGGSTQALSVYCAGILFNLAILHHKHGMNDGSPAFLDKAAAFYRTALEIIEANTDLFEQDPTLLLLAFITHNNLAQLELENGMVDKVNQRLHCMAGILYKRKRTILMALSNKMEVKGLVSNILGAGRLNTAQAA